MESSNLVSLLDRGIELAPAKLIDIEGFTHIDKDNKVELFTPPRPKAVGVATLAGLVGLLAAEIDELPDGVDNLFIHVESHTRVTVRHTSQDHYGFRRTFVIAELAEQQGFRYNTFIGQEEFNIGLRSQFVPDGNLAALLQVTGNLAKQSEARQEDDGITQRVTVKTGIALQSETTPPSRVTIAPYRTFREAIQPPSDFVFRVKCSDNGNQCALFEADGGYWKIAAAQNVKSWLSNALAGTSHELGDIPIIY